MAEQLSLGVKLPDATRFDNFFPGPNVEALSQVRALASGQSLYLHGPPESGRSHLLQASCRQAAEQDQQAIYLPMAELRLISPQVLDGIETAVLVAIDDIDAVAGEPHWEEALFDAFNRLHAADGRLLMSAADRPEAAGFQLPDLVSRLTWGLVYGMKPLTDQDRLAVLQLRARQRGLDLPNEVGEFLLKRTPRGLSALCDLIEQLDEASLAAQRRLTIPFVKSVLTM